MPLSQLRLLIRADAGPKIGTGHVMRMMALGQAFIRKGGVVSFVASDLPVALGRRLESSEFDVVTLPNGCDRLQDAVAVRELMALRRPDWVALDGYDFDDEYQEIVAAGESKLLVMDDDGHARHQHCDVLVNQNLGAKRSDYEAVPGRTVLAGGAYTLLREEFFRINDPVARRRPRRVLVTFGGADPDNWTLRTLQALADLQDRRLAVDCVIGPAYQHVAELRTFQKHARLNLKFHDNVQRMASLMQRVDLAVTAGGSTCYELARCGVPAVVVAIADNQRRVARAMDDCGAMVSIDREDCGVDHSQQLVDQIGRLLTESECRLHMSRAGRQLIDGQGAARVVNQMAGQRLKLRSAEAEDVHQLWVWRNDPEVRSVSFQSEAIALDVHRAWFERQLGNSQSRIWIANFPDGTPLGQVRFSLQPQCREATIGIVLDQAWRCRGWGSVLISAAVEQLLAESPIDCVIAQIKPGNTPSERAFQRAGFVAIEPTMVPGGLALQYCRYRDGHSPPLARAAG